MSMSRARHLSIGLCLAIYAGLSGVIIYAMITRWTRATTLVTAVLHLLMLLAVLMLVASGMGLLLGRLANCLLRLTAFVLQRHLRRNQLATLPRKS
jgi:hypothetical protein